MANRKRPIILRCPVTVEERKLIEQKMALLHTQRIGAYLRKMAIDEYIINLDTTDIKAFTAELGAIGRNINQISKRVNAGGSVYKEDIQEIRERLDEIWLLQRRILSNQPSRLPLTISAIPERQTGSCWSPPMAVLPKLRILNLDGRAAMPLTEAITTTWAAT